MSYPGRTRPRVGWLVAAALLGSVLAPATAAAHIRSGISATDYVVSLDPLPARAASAVSASVSAGDQSLTLAMQTGHTVVVLGDDGARYLRLGPEAAADTWHDPRLRRLAPGTERGKWTVPLLVDGEPVLLTGGVRRVERPSLAPWLALAGAFAVLTALLVAFRRRAPLEAAAVVLAALSALAVVATAVGFALDSEASPATWVQSANEIVLAAAGLAVLAFGSGAARIAASALLGLLAISAALLELEVLRHGIVLAALPADAARTAVVLSLTAGTAALIVAAAAFAVPSGRGADAVDTPARL